MCWYAGERASELLRARGDKLLALEYWRERSLRLSSTFFPSAEREDVSLALSISKLQLVVSLSVSTDD